jgi:prevent-host-death family protein
MNEPCMLDLRDAEIQLPNLIERAERGEGIVISRDGKPAAALISLSEADLALGKQCSAREGEIRIASRSRVAGEAVERMLFRTAKR